MHRSVALVLVLGALLALPLGFAGPRFPRPPSPPRPPPSPPAPPPIDFQSALLGTWQGECSQYAAAYPNGRGYCYNATAVKDAVKFKYTFTFTATRYSFSTEGFNRTVRGVPLYYPALLGDGNYTITPKNFTDDKGSVSNCITVNWTDGSAPSTFHVSLEYNPRMVKGYTENGYVNTTNLHDLNLCPGKANPGLTCSDVRFNYRCTASPVMLT
mmetsp:Transcript_5212/g.11384  ORF Transcript_5212/g.11384 Transcript_5212/m.11384 type:complete len:213 (+) Transcript_5212:75-713(+)